MDSRLLTEISHALLRLVDKLDQLIPNCNRGLCWGNWRVCVLSMRNHDNLARFTMQWGIENPSNMTFELDDVSILTKVFFT